MNNNDTKTSSEASGAGTSAVADEKAAVLSLLGLQAAPNQVSSPKNTTDRPNSISPVLEPASPAGVALAKIGTKRKHHATVSGQFEDASDDEDDNVFSKQQAKSPESAPPPPHLIQQISNEILRNEVPPPPSLQAQISGELVQQAALAYHQRLEAAAAVAAAARLPPSLAPLMSGGPRPENVQAIWQWQQQQAAAARAHAMNPAAGWGAMHPGLVNNGLRAANNPNKNVPLQASNALAPPRVVVEDEGEDSENDTKEEMMAAKVRAREGVAISVTSSKKARRGSGGPRHMTKVRYEECPPPKSWGELVKVPRMAPVGPDNDKRAPVIDRDFRPQDVLLGRGGLTNINPGNIRFRALVSEHRIHYCTAPKGDKGALARYLCNYVRHHNGRFLQKNPGDDMWYEVGDEKAVMKCGQALREGSTDLVKRRLDPSEVDAIRAMQAVAPRLKKDTETNQKTH